MTALGVPVRRLSVVRGTLAAALFLCGCATPHVHPHADLFQRPEFAFLREGSTTRADACLQLGSPVRSYEGERILAWSLARQPDGSFRPALPQVTSGQEISWTASLVLVFGADGRLVRGSLVVVE
jgi:hypothetical protein